MRISQVSTYSNNQPNPSFGKVTLLASELAVPVMYNINVFYLKGNGPGFLRRLEKEIPQDVFLKFNKQEPVLNRPNGGTGYDNIRMFKVSGVVGDKNGEEKFTGFIARTGMGSLTKSIIKAAKRLTEK